MPRKLTTEEFIKKAIKVHGDKYDYSKTKYVRNDVKVIIICKKHTIEFEQIANNHLQGHGCLKCGIIKTAKKRKLTTEEFIRRAIEMHGDKYNYSKVEYGYSINKIIIICKYHNKKFEQSPHSHLRGSGCPLCGEEKRIKVQRKSLEQFIEESSNIHNNKYDYSKVEYKNSKSKVIIICPVHKNFVQSPAHHLQGDGCPYCQKKNEGKIKKLLDKNFSDWKIISNKKIWDKYKKYKHKRYCDFWLEKNGLKIIVEYDGEGHFMPVCFNGISFKKAQKKFKKRKKIDKLDFQFCKENNIILHRVRYNEDKEKSIIKFKEKLIKKYGIK